MRHMRSHNASRSSDWTFRICDVTDEGLVILELARLADRSLNRGSYAELHAELRQRLGRNGALLAVARFVSLDAEGEEPPE